MPNTATIDRRARILVADDERSMRELLAIVLKREGYDVVLAEDGRSALAALESVVREDDLPRIIDLLLAATSPSEVSSLQNALAALSKTRWRHCQW
jgi:DNA-binding NtrC family response regulator